MTIFENYVSVHILTLRETVVLQVLGNFFRTAGTLSFLHMRNGFIFRHEAQTSNKINTTNTKINYSATHNMGKSSVRSVSFLLSFCNNNKNTLHYYTFYFIWIFSVGVDHQKIINKSKLKKCHQSEQLNRSQQWSPIKTNVLVLIKNVQYLHFSRIFNLQTWDTFTWSECEDSLQGSR